jgi:molybdopterin-synthase adenylyltransferase
VTGGVLQDMVTAIGGKPGSTEPRVETLTDRYSRQVLFSGIGAAGQAKIGRGRILLVGCGALGSVIAEILVRAGVGSITIADRDYVEESNLQRQSLYTEEDCRQGLPKAIAAAGHLRAINSSVEVRPQVLDVRSSTIEELVLGQDVVLDGTDNFETRYLLNDASLRWNIPWVYGACVGAYGMSVAFVPHVTPCLRCILQLLPPPGSSPTCDTIGVIGPIVHVVGALESTEALKLLTGHKDLLNRKLITMDLWANRVATMDLSAQKPDCDCPACGRGQLEFLDGLHEGHADMLCGRNAVQISRLVPRPVDLEPIAKRLSELGSVTRNEFLLKAQIGEFELALFRDGRAIVKGTQDIGEARRVYSRFVGD